MTEVRRAGLRSLWSDLEAAAAGGHEYRAQRLRSSAPIAVYAALREGDGARSIVFEGPSAVAPRARTSFPGEGISFAEDRAPQEGLYRIASSLEGLGFVGPFEALCCDLIDVAEVETTAQEAFSSLARRMATWMASLRRRGGLSEEAARGLLGELYSLAQVAELVGWGAAVTGWEGPDDGIHDLTANGSAWEVKTSLGPGSAIWINGLDQLDDTGLGGLGLVHHTLTTDPAAGASLRDFAQTLRLAIQAAAPAAVAEFERKLVAANFLGSEASAVLPYRRVATAYFRVSETFPRLLRRDVSIGIAEAQYRVNVAALQGHALTSEQALEMLRLPGGAA